MISLEKKILVLLEYDRKPMSLDEICNMIDPTPVRSTARARIHGLCKKNLVQRTNYRPGRKLGIKYAIKEKENES